MLYLICLTVFLLISCHCCEEYCFDFTPTKWNRVRNSVTEPLKFGISQLKEKCSNLLLTKTRPCVAVSEILLKH